MTFIRGAGLRAVEVEPGLQGVKLLDGAEGARHVSLVRGSMAPGARHSAHTHEVEEGVMFLGGHGVVEVAGRAYEVGPGDVVHIPPHTVHSTLNTGSEELTFVAAFADNLIAANPLHPAGAAPSEPRAQWRHRLAWLLRRVAGRLVRTP